MTLVRVRASDVAEADKELLPVINMNLICTKHSSREANARRYHNVSPKAYSVPSLGMPVASSCVPRTSEGESAEKILSCYSIPRRGLVLPSRNTSWAINELGSLWFVPRRFLYLRARMFLCSVDRIYDPVPVPFFIFDASIDCILHSWFMWHNGLTIG